jgi:hypothetical protein
VEGGSRRIEQARRRLKKYRCNVEGDCGHPWEETGKDRGETVKIRGKEKERELHTKETVEFVYVEMHSTCFTYSTG